MSPSARNRAAASPELPDAEDDVKIALTSCLPACSKCKQNYLYSRRLVHDFFYTFCGGTWNQHDYGCGARLTEEEENSLEVWRYGHIDKEPSKSFWSIKTSHAVENKASGSRTLRVWKCTAGAPAKTCRAQIKEHFPSSGDRPADAACIWAHLVDEQMIGGHDHPANMPKVVAQAQRAQADLMLGNNMTPLQVRINLTQTEVAAETAMSLDALRSRARRNKAKTGNNFTDRDVAMLCLEKGGECPWSLFSKPSHGSLVSSQPNTWREALESSTASSAPWMAVQASSS